MALLDDAIDASGGMARWRGLKAFTLHLSVDGALFARRGKAGRYKDMVAEGATQTQCVRFTGFDGSGKCGSYRPDCITIERGNGEVLRSRQGWHPTLLGDAHNWDELDLVAFCGFSIWNYLTTPFLLAHPDIQIEELPPWHEDDGQRGKRWRRLRAVFPAGIVTHSREQLFYFDDKGLQRRTDHDFGGTRVAHYSWAHQAFGAIVVPTLRRSLELRPDGHTIRTPALIDVEIFDVSFE